MKKIGITAALSMLIAGLWMAGCGGGTPNCDAYIAAAKACCDKAPDAATKTSCNSQQDAAAKLLKDAATAAGTDCADGSDKTIVCPYK
jgi:uncharacterized lipoprotein YmbA